MQGTDDEKSDEKTRQSTPHKHTCPEPVSRTTAASCATFQMTPREAGSTHPTSCNRRFAWSPLEIGNSCAMRNFSKSRKSKRVLEPSLAANVVDVVVRRGYYFGFASRSVSIVFRRASKSKFLRAKWLPCGCVGAAAGSSIQTFVPSNAT